MAEEFNMYSCLLKTGKWISKTDFIYRVKLNCDCSEEKHSKFLRSLYTLHFSLVKKDFNGRIILQY